MRKAPDLVVPLALTATGALLGISTLIAKAAMARGVPPMTFLVLSSFGAAVLLLLANAGNNVLPLSRRTVEYFAVAGLLSFALPNSLLYAAIPHVGAGFASLALAFPPVLTYLGAVALRMDPPDRWRILAVVLALFGAGTLAFGKGLKSDVSLGWLTAVVVVPVFLALGNLYRTRRWPAGAKPGALAPGMLAAAAIALFVLGLLPAGPMPWPAATASSFGWIGLQSATFAAQYLLFFVVQQRAGPVYLSLIGAIAALVAVPASILLFEETPPALVGPAALMTLSGVALLVWRSAASSAPR